MYFYFNFGNYIPVDTRYYSPCRGRRWSAECCWFKVVEVVDLYILLPRAMLAKRNSCLRCYIFKIFYYLCSRFTSKVWNKADVLLAFNAVDDV